MTLVVVVGAAVVVALVVVVGAAVVVALVVVVGASVGSNVVSELLQPSAVQMDSSLQYAALAPQEPHLERQCDVSRQGSPLQPMLDGAGVDGAGVDGVGADGAPVVAGAAESSSACSTRAGHPLLASSVPPLIAATREN